jgi:hypothetical protein
MHCIGVKTVWILEENYATVQEQLFRFDVSSFHLTAWQNWHISSTGGSG